ncbi:MAG: hypothetical protein Alpg2KO_30790 [Alphaproteobacteria bacterium]
MTDGQNRQGDPPDWEVLAEQWLTLWQDGLSDLARNKELARLMGQLLPPWAESASHLAPFLNMMSDSPARDDLQAQIDALKARLDEMAAGEPDDRD